MNHTKYPTSLVNVRENFDALLNKRKVIEFISAHSYIVHIGNVFSQYQWQFGSMK